MSIKSIVASFKSRAFRAEAIPMQLHWALLYITYVPSQHCQLPSLWFQVRSPGRAARIPELMTFQQLYVPSQHCQLPSLWFQVRSPGRAARIPELMTFQQLTHTPKKGDQHGTAIKPSIGPRVWLVGQLSMQSNEERVNRLAIRLSIPHLLKFCTEERWSTCTDFLPLRPQPSIFASDSALGGQERASRVVSSVDLQ